MNRQTPAPFSAAAAPRGAAPTYKAQQAARVPVEFIQAMKLIQGQPSKPDVRTFVTASRTQLVQRRAGQPPVKKWKSSFKPVDGDDDSDDKDTSSSKGVDLYDPYHPALLDSELEVMNRSNSEQDNTLQHCLSQDRGCKKKSRWDCSDQDIQLFRSEKRPCENPGFSPAHRLPYNPNTESIEPLRYDNIGRLQAHRGQSRLCSPDRGVHGASAQRLPTSYGGQRTNGEERMMEYRREVSPVTDALRLPRSQRGYHQQETGQDRINLGTEVTRNSQKTIIADESPITCDLCEVELSNGQELEDHLDSKSHWDTLEHIQQQNDYDDLTVAFLQEVMLYKSRQSSRAIEDSALQALQENDHMTKVEMFHCAACDIFVSTSASSVQAHITSQGHLSNTKGFEAQQRLACLSKAETIIKKLKPQFEHFMQGGTPFG
ncbi:uncharacterized protein LOC114844639 [Betta splendens]|uniref:DBIRD complex subunit ZNF326 n=1 Tax=Betta splendens TaxID=158456 RepID=A0A6P7L025_BETSP|nr:uncharacterized protein LOC114844639 [Betta splendens]